MFNQIYKECSSSYPQQHLRFHECALRFAKLLTCVIAMHKYHSTVVNVHLHCFPDFIMITHDSV